MEKNKNFKIIHNLEDDAPFGDINWITISFLTPQNIEKTKYFDVKGFKIHNGYNTAELANDDAKKIKDKNKNHDVYISQIGKIYAWDDTTKTDSIEYDDSELNNLEKTRRENMDKIKLLAQQSKNEYSKIFANTNSERLDAQMKRMQEKLYKKGSITQKEYEMLQTENKPVKGIKEIAKSLESIQEEMEECYKTDYLDENEPTALKYGCASIFSPKHIGGLKTLCFKVRGLFETPLELSKRVKKLQSKYPNERIYNFEVGKWCGFAENDSIDQLILLKQLNFSMKCYLENLEHETEEFNKRKDSLKSRTEQEAKIVKANNRVQKRREKREAEKKKKKSGENNTMENNSIQNFQDVSQPSNQEHTQNLQDVHDVPNETFLPTNNAEDNEAIQNIINFLDDPELKNKFAANKSTLQTLEMNMD